MSHTRVKTTYIEEAGFGNTDTKTLYCDHNHGTNTVMFYDKHGRIMEMIFWELQPGKDLWDAMQRLWKPYVSGWGGELVPGVEYYNEEELNTLDVK